MTTRRRLASILLSGQKLAGSWVPSSGKLNDGVDAVVAIINNLLYPRAVANMAERCLAPDIAPANIWASGNFALLCEVFTVSASRNRRWRTEYDLKDLGAMALFNHDGGRRALSR